MRKLILALLLGIVVSGSGCQTWSGKRINEYNFNVDGVVKAEDGTPVEDAEVTLNLNYPVFDVITLIRTAKRITNDKGDFAFGYISHAPSVEYTITVRKEGFEQQVVSGSAPPPQRHTIRLRKARD